MTLIKKTTVILLLCLPLFAFAWDSTGHRLIAQIAYARLTPTARVAIDQLTAEKDKNYPPLSRFLYASVWPDSIKGQNNQYNSWHFINYPYSPDGTPVSPLAKENLVWAIQLSEKVLQDPNGSREKKAIFLRFLVHFVGDAHQPLHCINRYTHDYPHGDQGGVLASIQDPYDENLHGYWDEGVGFFRQEKKYPLRKKAVAHLAQRIVNDYPPQYFGNKANDLNPTDWTQESFALAKDFAYNTPAGAAPSVAYNKQGQKIVEQQVALAGYRLANLLNQMFSGKASN